MAPTSAQKVALAQKLSPVIQNAKSPAKFVARRPMGIGINMG